MKKIILIFICLFCIGCEARYELKINEDLSVNESITGLETEEFYSNYPKSTKERVISFMSETKDEYLNEIGYSKDIVTEGNLTGALFSKRFGSLKEYFTQSQAYKQFYDGWDYSINDGIVIIELNNQLLRNEDSIERYVIDNCDVSITLPFKVRRSNADSVNKKTNTYTWNLNDKESKDIYIKFDTKQEAKYIDKKYIGYILIIGLIIGVFYLIYYVYDKREQNNRID